MLHQSLLVFVHLAAKSSAVGQNDEEVKLHNKLDSIWHPIHAFVYQPHGLLRVHHSLGLPSTIFPNKRPLGPLEQGQVPVSIAHGDDDFHERHNVHDPHEQPERDSAQELHLHRVHDHLRDDGRWD